MRALTKPAFQASSVISLPRGSNQVRSFTSAPRMARPWKKVRRRKTGCRRCRSRTWRVKARRSCWARGEAPVEPAQLVVLAVGVVVSPARHLVAHADHRHALREEQGGEEVAHLARAEGEDGGSSVGPSTPQFQLRLWSPVAVLVAVRLVVLAVVAHEVVEGEAVVGGHEVDAGVRPPPGAAVEVAAAGEAGGELGDGPPVPPPETAHRVAVAAVPLRPADREVADLVAPLAQVPRLGDGFTWESTGSWWMMSKKAESRSTSKSSRASALARSKRKPSTCISSTQ